MKELILGGVRSGKSRLAEQHAIASGLPVTLIATATIGDAEMQQRIDRHRRHRPVHWEVVEEPHALAAALCTHASPNRCVIIDCLTLWMTNLLGVEEKSFSTHERYALLNVLRGLPGHIIFVSNETGMGVVPMGELSRRFCDESGRLHQDLARLSDRVILTVAGLPHVLKGKL